MRNPVVRVPSGQAPACAPHRLEACHHWELCTEGLPEQGGDIVRELDARVIVTRRHDGDGDHPAIGEEDHPGIVDARR